MSKRNLREAVKKQVAYSQQYKCGLCNVLLPPTFQVDHIVPHSISLDDSENNLQALCPNCHAKKTQKENIRILQFKKRQANYEYRLCWFCLEKLEDHKCDRVLRNVECPKKVELDPFTQECNKHIYIKGESKEISRVLSIEIHLYNLCVYVNNVVYKSNSGDITMKDVGDAVSLATRTKRDSGRYNSVEVKLVGFENDTEEEKKECCEFIEKDLMANLPERIFQKDATIFMLVDY